MTQGTVPAVVVGKKMATVLSQLEARQNAQSAQARRRIVESAARHPVYRPYRWAGALATAGVVTALALGLFRWSRHVEVPAYYVDGKPSEIRGFVAAPVDRESQLRFSDGSRMELAPEAAVRVLEVGAHGATVNLEHGRVQADIIPRANNEWLLTAGPFTVHVIGTRFGVHWDVASERLTVAVERGKVAIWGAFISKREVEAGHVLRADVRSSSVVESGAQANVRAESSSAATSVTEATLPPEASARPTELPTATKASSLLAAGNIKPTWRQLADAGRFRESLAEVEASGFDSTCTGSSASDLLVLGDVARLAGQPARARQAFLAVRSRFPQDSRRVAAAFSLGKVAFDQLGDLPQAVDWFRTCLREQPNGTLAREAHGRLIEGLKRLGDREGAKKAASEYLEKYPTGPHAAVARSILGG